MEVAFQQRMSLVAENQARHCFGGPPWVSSVHRHNDFYNEYLFIVNKLLLEKMTGNVQRQQILPLVSRAAPQILLPQRQH